jgi:caffeoyl-CoA O-methyltransferase
MADNDSRAGEVYWTKGILDWVAQLHAPHDEALDRAFTAPVRQTMPSIQLGASESKLLTMLLQLSGARRVVEVGTLAGYSALRLVQGLPADGKVYSIESEARHAEVALQVIAEAGEAHRVEVLVGAGVDMLKTLEPQGPFDAVFIDADKESYDAYGRWAAAHLRRGGLLLADNVYLFGHLLDDSLRAEMMRRFHVEAKANFETVCVPTPDGLLVGIKR